VQVCSGAAIEDTLGASLGLSTLAAAGLGNAASDGIGIGKGYTKLFFKGLQAQYLYSFVHTACRTASRTAYQLTESSILSFWHHRSISLFLFLIGHKQV
jgi:Transmembrane protein 65